MDDWKIKFLRKLFFYEETVAPFDMNDIFDFVHSYDLFIDNDNEEQFIDEEDSFRTWIEEDIEEDEENLELVRLKKWLEEKGLLELLDMIYVEK